MEKSPFEIRARRMAKQLGATIRRDDRNQVMVVSLGDKKQQFWSGSWPVVVMWLRKQMPTAATKVKKRNV